MSDQVRALVMDEEGRALGTVLLWPVNDAGQVSPLMEVAGSYFICVQGLNKTPVYQRVTCIVADLEAASPTDSRGE